MAGVLLPLALHAQTFKPVYTDSVSIAGNGVDVFHTLTLTAPSLSSNPSITLPGASLVFPGANASGVLTNDGSGNLTWSPSSGAGWSLTGNAGISGSDFLGTTDAKDLVLKGDNVTGLTVGGAANAGNVGIGTTPTTNTLAVGGNIEMTNATNDKVTTANSELVLEQTGDTYGTTRLYLQNRNGSNGALFEQANASGINLVDFGFKPGAGVQSNLRLEARTSTIRNTANDAFGEFEFMMNTLGSGGSPTYNFSTGEGASSFEVGNVGIGMVNPTQKLQLQSGNLLLSTSSANPDSLEFQGTSTGITTLHAGAQGSTNINYTLPIAAPTTSGEVLSSTTNGTMSWSSAGLTGASLQSSSANPTGTTSTTGVMMGLAGSITPDRSGTVLIIVTGTITNSNNSDGGIIQIRYSTGTAPTNGAGLTGTASGASVKYKGGGKGNPSVPFCVTVAISGLTLNTPIWIDVSLASVTGGGTATISGVAISAVEL